MLRKLQTQSGSGTLALSSEAEKIHAQLILEEVQEGNYLRVREERFREQQIQEIVILLPTHPLLITIHE